MDTGERSLALTEVLDLALKAGLLVHQSGGDTARTGQTIRRMARALGAERAESAISSLNIGLTVARGHENETAFRKAPHMGANFTLLSSVEQVVEGVESGRVGAAGAHTLLDDLHNRRHFYPRWLIALTVGLSCGGFAALFGGDTMAIIDTTLGAAIGMALRLWLHGRHYKPFLFALASSFIALLIAGALAQWGPMASATPEFARAASVLFLIPGVPLINGASDLFNANYLNGLVRITMGVVFVVGIALGVSLALRLL